MSLVPRNNLFDIDRFFGDQWPAAFEAQGSIFFFFFLVIKVADGHYEITAELPGVTKEGSHVHVKDGVLTLEAETRMEDSEEKEGKLIRQERRYGKYMRSFNLGADIKEEDIKASFSDGVLRLQAPKLAPRAPERRRISID